MSELTDLGSLCIRAECLFANIYLSASLFAILFGPPKLLAFALVDLGSLLLKPPLADDASLD